MKKSVGVYYLFSADQICSSVGATIGRPRAFDERPYKTISNFLMRSPILPVFLFYEKEQDEEEDNVVKAVASVGEKQDQGEDEKLLRADAAVLAEKRAEPQTKSAL